MSKASRTSSGKHQAQRPSPGVESFRTNRLAASSPLRSLRDVQTSIQPSSHTGAQHGSPFSNAQQFSSVVHCSLKPQSDTISSEELACCDRAIEDDAVIGCSKHEPNLGADYSDNAPELREDTPSSLPYGANVEGSTNTESQSVPSSNFDRAEFPCTPTQRSSQVYASCPVVSQPPGLDQAEPGDHSLFDSGSQDANTVSLIRLCLVCKRHRVLADGRHGSLMWSVLSRPSMPVYTLTKTVAVAGFGQSSQEPGCLKYQIHLELPAPAFRVLPVAHGVIVCRLGPLRRYQQDQQLLL